MQVRVRRFVGVAMRTHALAMLPATWMSICLSHTRRTVVERLSRRRYAASNTRGRVGQAKDLLETLKSKSKEEAKTFYDTLHPRDKLDVVRLLHQKRAKRRQDRASSSLPKYYSVPFEKNYFFREEDISEESTLGRGPGGQATNRRMQTVIVKHVPSGIIVKFSRFPSLWLNRRAARELLHLRLEEHLLGPKSRLGRARAEKERRHLRRQRTVAYLTKKGRRLEQQEGQQCHWAAFLEGLSSLPESALAQLGRADPSTPVTMGLLLGAECGNWWPMVQHAVEGAKPNVPLLLRHVFPVTYADSTEAEKNELQRCKASTAARANVSRAFVCFCELFGLRLLEVPASSPVDTKGRRVVLRKDGLNWVQCRSRLWSRDDGALTAVAQVCWPHVYLSLRELDMLPEARSIVVFFKKEGKALSANGSGANQKWAQVALQCLTRAVRESTLPPAPASETVLAAERAHEDTAVSPCAASPTAAAA